MVTIPGRQTTITPQRGVSLTRAPVVADRSLEVAGAALANAAIKLKEQENTRIANERVLEGLRQGNADLEAINSDSDLTRATVDAQEKFSKERFEKFVASSGNSAIQARVRQGLGRAFIGFGVNAERGVRRRSNTAALTAFSNTLEEFKKAAGGMTQEQIAEGLVGLNAMAADLEQTGVARKGSTKAILEGVQKSISADRLQRAMLPENINGMRGAAKSEKAFRALFPGLANRERRILSRAIEARDRLARVEARQELALRLAQIGTNAKNNLAALKQNFFGAVPTPGAPEAIAAARQIAGTPAQRAAVASAEAGQAQIEAIVAARGDVLEASMTVGGVQKLQTRISTLRIETAGAPAATVQKNRITANALALGLQTLQKANAAGTLTSVAAQAARQPLVPLADAAGALDFGPRAAQVSTLRARFPGLPTSGFKLLLPAEATSVMGSLLKAPPGQRIALATKLAGDAGADLPGVLAALRGAKIDPAEPQQQIIKNGFVAMIGMVQENPSAAGVLGEGIEALRAERPQPTDADFASSYQTELGNGTELFGTRGADARQVAETIKIIYAGLAFRENTITLDNNLMAQATKLALGGVLEPDGDVRGGPASFNGVLTQFLVGMPKDEFSTRLQLIDRKLLEQAGTGAPRFGKIEDGKIASAGVLASMQWRRLQDGRYMVTDELGKPFLQKDGRTVWTTDLRKAFAAQGAFADILKVRKKALREDIQLFGIEGAAAAAPTALEPPDPLAEFGPIIEPVIDSGVEF